MTHRNLRRWVKKQLQKGFTLLELLIVVAILAAIAGTATIALQDTDARASAAAHVAMMDEINKGIRTYRVLNGNVYPNNWDSLLQNDGTTVSILPNDDGEVLGIGDIATFTLTDDFLGPLNDIGIDNLRVVDTTADPEGNGACNDLQGLINNRGNAVVAGNLFLSPEANGCGDDLDITADGDATNDPVVAVWTGGNERVLGAGALDAVDATGNVIAANEGAQLLMAVGAGPSSDLFNASQLGGLTTVPVYRHVAQDQYNRFIVLFHVGTVEGGVIVPVDQVSVAAVVDGAGDTKEEELGEWDGTRNTI